MEYFIININIINYFSFPNEKVWNKFEVTCAGMYRKYLDSYSRIFFILEKTVIYKFPFQSEKVWKKL